MVAQTRHAGQPSPKRKLEFRDKLVGKGLSTDALLKKLKTLHTQLAALDQDHVDVGSLNTARKELIHSSILLHKDRGVKAYAACCLADVLRLYAPDAPYTQPELRDIFQFFFRQLSNGLKGADATYFNEYFHLLESLSTVKSVVLVCDLPAADELMGEIFREFFSLVRRDISKKVELFMADILVALLDEAQSIPTEVMDTILAQFTDKNARIDQPAFRLAVSICNATADKLQRNVCQYFSEIISSHSEDEEYDDIRNAHDLIKTLHRSCPGVLHSVIPLLEEELRADDVTIRMVATQVLGEMFGDKAGGDLLRKYPTTWNVWVGRKSDKSVPIRLKLVESCRNLIVNRPEAREAIEGVMKEKVLDPDEKVRAAVCKVYSQLDYESAFHHVSQAQLQAVAGRGLDKKASVRVEALNAVGKLYSLAYPEIEANDSTAIVHFAWIPEEVLKITSTSAEVRNVVEQVIADHILPLPSSGSSSSTKGPEIDETAWTDRLLCVMRYLSEKSIKALLAISGLKAIRPNIYQVFIDSCIKYNGGIMDEDEEIITRRLNASIQHIAVNFSDPHKTQEDLHSFAKLNENRLFKLAKTLMDPQTDLKTLVKTTHEFTRRLETSSAALLPTLSAFLRRASFRILNTSSLPALLKRVGKAYGSTADHLIETASRARALLTFASKWCAVMYKPHVPELVKAIGGDEKNVEVLEVALQALSGLVRAEGAGVAPTDKKINEKIEKFAMHESWRLAKFATRYLAFSKQKKEACARVAKAIADEYAAAGSVTDAECLASRAAALVQLSRFNADAFEKHSSVYTAFLVKKLVMGAPLFDADGDTDMDDGEEWFENADVPELLRAKIQALKVCRYRCLAHADKENAAEMMAAPVMKMYATLLEHNGSVRPAKEGEAVEGDPKFLSRLRLQGAVSILHLVSVPKFAETLQPKFLRVAVTIQDSCYNVRFDFLTKLLTLLQPRKVPPQYNIIPFLTVHDPEDDIKTLASSYVESAKRRMPQALRTEHLELIFIRLLHLLAHHPDFSTAHDDLVDIAKYVQFYLDLMATQDNVSLLHHLALKAKTVRDYESHSENLYIMAELAQELIKKKAQDKSWTIQTYPGKVRLPADILRPLPSSEASKEVFKATYLPEETRLWLEELSRTALPREKKERKVPAKRKAASRGEGGTKRRRKRARSEAGDDDDDEDDEGRSSGIEDNGDEDVDMDVDQNGRKAATSSPTPRAKGTRASARNRTKQRRDTSPLTEPTDDDE